jgi:FkbM family methyltransferase
VELSYAQNLEDYHLAQVFAGQETGFYIDIGAGHPVGDNVSFWFYLQGWRGLVVEPQPGLAELYAHIRPRDTVVCGLVGATTGEADFHEVDRLHGLSTTVEAHAREAAAFGAGFRTLRRPMQTLAALCEQNQVEVIDFLKVDVEGAEAAVLEGADFARFRPRVVVVEAVRPGTMEQAWAGWQPLLTTQGYGFAFDDGLNRFYVADEEMGLRERFPAKNAAWGVVRHLYEFGRAPENPEHPDHGLAITLVQGFLAALPRLPNEVVWELLQAHAASVSASGAVERAAPDGSMLSRSDLSTDRFRAALGRIAAPYDGGQLLDD